jgi:hypothetical protein
MLDQNNRFPHFQTIVAAPRMPLLVHHPEAVEALSLSVECSAQMHAERAIWDQIVVVEALP